MSEITKQWQEEARAGVENGRRRITPLMKQYLYELGQGYTDLNYQDWKVFTRKSRKRVS
jgi:hypothetical protein